MQNHTLWVRKDHLATTHWHDIPTPALATGHVRLRVDRFALTANNITYGAFGDAMNYWQFFPTGDVAWGCIPVWGFATVQQSAHPDVAVGERVYGYFPMGATVDMAPARVGDSGWSDSAPHRAALHPVYNQYLRCDSDPFYAATATALARVGGAGAAGADPSAAQAHSEAVQALLRPLFVTSWLIDDFLADQGFFGTQVVMLSSASSKTAYGAAWALAQRTGIRVVGLTSAANVAFCEGLGCYDRVLTYEQLDALPADTPCVYVDFAGNAALRRTIHTRFTALAHSCSVGGTHVDQLGGAKDLPGPRATLFFAPAQIKKRQADWGGPVLGQRLVTAWQAFAARVTQPGDQWLKIQGGSGPEVVASTYAQVLAGRGDPRVGHVLTV
jgi:hypothetical protein